MFAAAVGCSPSPSRSFLATTANQPALVFSSTSSSSTAAEVWRGQLSLNSARRGPRQRITVKLDGPPPARQGREKGKKPRKKEHHLWMRRDSAGSGHKALNLVRIASQLPNEKEAIYEALDKWAAFEAEFPVIAAAKALEILRRRNQWLRIIQVVKWLLSKGQVMTMGTYDLFLLALDMEGRVDEAEAAWCRLLETHSRSISRRLFSRIISLYDHHHLPAKIVEVFADMEELGVKPDEDTVRRIGRAFQSLGQENNRQRLFLKYQKKFGYLHFNGERVRVRTSQGFEDGLK